MSVSFRIPAYLSNFETLDNGRTRAKLNAFYQGETEDGRIFSEEFAQKLAKTVPGTPVVAFFDDNQDDFVGHNAIQYVYGFVPTDVETKFETRDDGNTWLTTDTILFTDRADNIGEVAKKIVGKKQSLELSPNTVKYEVFKENGKTKIKFTEGSIIGFSVLGDNQKPAFTGSSFFEVNEFTEMRERFESFFSCLEEESRGEQMEFKNFESYANFVKLSYSDKFKMADEKISELVKDLKICYYIVDMDDEYIITEEYNYESDSHNYYKYSYTAEESDMKIETKVEVYKRFYTAEEIDLIENVDKQDFAGCKDEEDKKDCSSSEDEKEKNNCAEVEIDDKDKEDPKDPEDKEDKEKDDDFKCDPEKDKDESKCVETPDEQEKKGQDEDENTKEEPKKEEENMSKYSSALLDSEREELENYRRKERLELINSFDGMLEKEVLDNFKEKVDNYNYASLESELSILFAKYSRENGQKQNKSVPRNFSRIVTKTEETKNDYKSLVMNILNK